MKLVKKSVMIDVRDDVYTQLVNQVHMHTIDLILNKIQNIIAEQIVNELYTKIRDQTLYQKNDNEIIKLIKVDN